MVACAHCGASNPDRARFCLECGTAIAGAAVRQREVRKTVTIVFCDVTGSTALGERLDPESLRRVMSQYFDRTRSVLTHHGGTVEKFIGDAVMAVFGIPQMHEDDALRAVRATADMAVELERLNIELERTWGVRLQVRMGVNTGEVVAGDTSSGQNLVTGDAVNVAARLEQAAQPGEILLGPATYRLVRDAVEVEAVDPLVLKGKQAPVQAVRLVDVSPSAPGHARHLDAPLIGRSHELRMLEWAYRRVVDEQTCHLFTVLGPAGVGKSRLVAEATATMSSGAVVVIGECRAYGEGVTYWAVAAALRQALGAADESPDAILAGLDAVLAGDEHAELVAASVGALLTGGTPPLPGPAVSVDETAWAIRKVLEALCRKAPLVVVLDDLQWAEPALLDLVDHVAEWTHDAPILLVCVARPELLDERPAWAGGKRNATSIHLEPLSEDESSALLRQRLDGAELDESVRARISEAAEGNPLFCEEILAMLVEEGMLRPEGGRWLPAVDFATVSIPVSIQALLGSRLDRLGPAEARVLARASIAGKVFERAAVIELSAPEDRPAVPGSLLALARKDIIRPGRSALAGGDAFQFRHVLLRDAEYESLPKQDRAELHEAFGEWLAKESTARGLEYDAVIGHHLEVAHRYRLELGPEDDPGRALARRAAHRLAVAGRRALDREDVSAAAGYLPRAAALAGGDATAQAELLHDAATALLGAGELSATTKMLDEAASAAAATGNEALQAHVLLSRLQLRLQTEPGAAVEVAEQEAQRAIGVFQAIGDERGLARAWSVVANVHWTRCRAAAAEHAQLQAVAHARAAGDEAEEAAHLGGLVGIALFGPTPVDEGVRLCEDVLARAGDRRSLEARALRALGCLRAMEGDVAGGRAVLARSIAIFEDLGWALWLAGALQVAGTVERMAGDPEASARHLRRSYELLALQGDKSYLAVSAGLLAHALHDLGRDDEAEQLAEVCRDAAAPDDVDSQMIWRTARAKILAARGDTDEAERLAAEALRLGDTTDLWVTADVQLDAGAVAAAVGRTDDARRLVQAAIDAYGRKGDRTSLARAERRLADLPAPTSGPAVAG
ncbi:MAG: adenylate/guanylate cyclase domain-containing protein [Acidimicrobiales bacterium]